LRGGNTAELNLTESVLDALLNRGVSIEFGLDDLPFLDRSANDLQQCCQFVDLFFVSSKNDQCKKSKWLEQREYLFIFLLDLLSESVRLSFILLGVLL